MEVSALYTIIPHVEDITATAPVLNTTNCQFPVTILRLIRFILDYNVFTFYNQFFIQTDKTASGNKLASQYTKMFMLQPMLYARHINDIFFFWTHGKESLKQLHSDIKRFHATIRPTMDYTSVSVSSLDTRISIRDRHFSTSLYRKPMDNLTMLHFSSFQLK
eukprot:g16422.t1